MKALSNIIVVLLVIVGVLALIPVVSIGFALLCAGGFFLIWLLPILIIASSVETTKGEKACWILAIIFLSWFAWIFYFFIAPLKPRPRSYHYY